MPEAAVAVSEARWAGLRGDPAAGPVCPIASHGRYLSIVNHHDNRPLECSSPALTAHERKSVQRTGSHRLRPGAGRADSLGAECQPRRSVRGRLLGEFATNRLRECREPGRTSTAAPYRRSPPAPEQPGEQPPPPPPPRLVGHAAHWVVRTGSESRWVAGGNGERAPGQRPERSQSAFRPRLTRPRRRRARERCCGGSGSRLCPESCPAPAASPRTTLGGPCPS